MPGRISEKDLKTRLGGIVETFFELLTPNEKDLFTATTVVGNLLNDVITAEKTHKATSTSRKASASLKPFIAGIEQYAIAFDVIANASSTILSPLWGSFRIVLLLAKEYSEYFDKISDMMEIMGLHLSQLRRLPQLFPGNEQLKTFMVEVFQIMFEFCSKARAVFVQANEKKGKNHLRAMTPIGLSTMIKLIWKPFKIQFGDIRTKLAECMAKIDVEINLAEKEEAHAERIRTAKDRIIQTSRWEETEQFHKLWRSETEENNMEKVTKWLAPADVISNHNASVKLRYGMTGSWFLQSTEFQDWLVDDISPLFWLHAIPGAGKTILASSIINYLRYEHQSDEIGLAYFYCDYKDPLKQEPSVVLRTLLSQLSNQNTFVSQHVQNFYKEQYKDDRVANLMPPSLDLLRSNFGQFLQTSFRKVFIVIDAIDECHDRECILKAITAIGDSVDHVKIVVSSREDPLINEEFKDFPNLKMKAAHVSGDIESYVNATLSTRIASKKLKVKDDELRQQILETLVFKAEGMFQWINCQIDHLCKFKTHNTIREALKHLPKTLEDTYLRILQSIDEDYSDVVQKLLKWLVRGTREMTLQELASAIAINPRSDNERVDPDDLMDPDDIVGYCSSLITISDEGKVSLAHFTVKEFLTSERVKETLNMYHIGLEEVHAELAGVCLTYLGYRDFDRQVMSSSEEVTKFLEQFSFLEYASKSWAIHAHQVSESETLIHGLIAKLFHSNNQRRGNYDLWLQMYFLQFRHGIWNIIVPPHVNPLYYASYFGLPKIAGSLLDEGAKPNIGDGPDDCLLASAIEGHFDVVEVLLKRCYEGGSKEELKRYLYLAASRGHFQTTEVLLTWGAPIESSGGKYGTPLQVAALEGHPEVVAILLKHGANFKVIDARFGMPLSAAAERGHRRVVQLLLEAGAPINGRGGWFSTPLMSAIVGKDEFIINKLLDSGANVNSQGGRHGCALMAAAAIGKIDLVKKLIDLDAKVNDENDKGADALHSACCAGRLDVVDLLLASGADVNAKGGKHRNALNAASAEGYPDIVQRLLTAGADPLAFDNHYGNALQAAAFHGHRDVVRILVEAGVNVNLGGGVRGSALVSAAASGNVEMVDVLISLGVPAEDTQDMRDALVIATRKQHEPLIRHLILLGAAVDGIGKLRSTSSLWSPLALSSNKGNLALVQTFLSLGANANAPAGHHGTVLIAATNSDHCNHKILEYLISVGAKVNEIVSPYESLPFSAITAATRRSDIMAVTLLLDHGADPNVYQRCWGTPLMDAVEQRNEALIDLLLERGADVNICIQPNLDLERDTGVITVIEDAARIGHIALIHRFVKAGANLTHARTDTVFKTPLQCAAYWGQEESVKELLALGMDPNTIGGIFGSALQAAAATPVASMSISCMALLLDAGANLHEHHIGKYGSATIASILTWQPELRLNFLLERGIDVNLNCGGEFPYAIIAMAYSGNTDGVRTLINNGADVNKYGGLWHSAIQAAMSDNAIGSFSTAAALLEAGADVNACGGQWGTALAAAYRCGYYLIIWKLYEHGASHAILGGKWGSALGSALSGACHTLVHQFVERHGVDVNQVCGKYGPAIHMLIKERAYDEEELVQLFLNSGADVDALGGQYGTPLAASIVKGEPGLFEDLLKRGADPNRWWEKSGLSPLWLACQTDRLDYAQQLIAHGADINFCLPRRGTPLQGATISGNKAIIQMLLDAGAYVNELTPGMYGTALNAAVYSDNREIVEYLLSHDADITLLGGAYHSILQVAALKASIPLLRYLLTKGASVNEIGGRHRTALQAACSAGRGKIAKILLMNGADPNIAGGVHGTALQAACANGKLSLVRLLLAYGADPKIKGGKYGSALIAAVLRGNPQVVKVLLAEEGITVDMLGEKRRHFSTKRWNTTKDVIKAALTNTKPLEAFNIDSIKLPGEEEELLKAEETVELVTDEPVSPETVDTETPQSPIGSSSEEGSDTVFVQRTDSMVAAAAEAIVQSVLPEQSKITNFVTVVEGEEKMEDMSALSWVQVRCGKGGDLDGEGW